MAFGREQHSCRQPHAPCVPLSLSFSLLHRAMMTLLSGKKKLIILYATIEIKWEKKIEIKCIAYHVDAIRRLTSECKSEQVKFHCYIELLWYLLWQLMTTQIFPRSRLFYVGSVHCVCVCVSHDILYTVMHNNMSNVHRHEGRYNDLFLIDACGNVWHCYAHIQNSLIV